MNHENLSVGAPEGAVKTRELKVGEEYTCYNWLRMVGKRHSVSIMPGAIFKVLPADADTTRNMPPTQGIYRVLEFNGAVRVTVNRKLLDGCYITNKEQE